ncbi:MAG TPA: ComF family protein [Candidatus Acidoferrales bacterium]|nr:ComF family protein [Candidatus Acidoferrales bacterium]
MLSFFRSGVDALISVLFPAPCRICGEVLNTTSLLPICDGCLASLAPLAGPSCDVCGRPFASDFATDAASPLCFACRRGVYAFDRARSYGSYSDKMARAISLLKYEKVLSLGNWFAAKLKERIQTEPEIFHSDVVVPVPLHAARRRERGYNQAELIARPLAKKLKLPLRAYLLVRTKPRPPRLLLSRRERWESVRGAYAMRRGANVDNLRVLLIDDVCTTGATLDSCARALKRAGAKSVTGLTVARVVTAGVPLPPSQARKRAIPGATPSI